MRSLTVVIPSRNAINLSACAVAARHFGSNVRLLVIDDGLEYWPNDVTMLLGNSPFCFAANVNLAIRHRCDDDVILLNDDALLRTPGGFTAMQVAAEMHPEYGILSAAVIGPSNSPEHKPRPYAAWWGPRQAAGKMVPFVCVLIPRRTIQTIGLLEERFGGVYGGEDDDYCYRVREAGQKIGIFDGCVVDHSQLKSTFRPDGRGLPIDATRRRFAEIHGFEMGSR